MLKRIIPILLLKNGDLVKSIKFRNHKYIGDIFNAVKIYNELEVDELILMDITASNTKNNINYKFLGEIATECFIPLSYAGNINNLEQIESLIKIGIEKVCINSASQDHTFISNAVKKFGASTISICIDYKYIQDEPIVYFSNATIKSKLKVQDHLSKMIELNVGEILLQNIDKDGTYSGYDIGLLKEVRNKIQNPIVIAGGCKNNFSIKEAFLNGANACAAGSLFVYYTNNKGILINYPDKGEMHEIGINR